MLMHTRITHRCKMKCMRLTLRRTSARRECLCTFSPLCTAGCSCCRTPLLLVRALVRRANFPHPEHRNNPHLTFALKCKNVHEYTWTTHTFRGVIFNWLFECCDVTKRTQEEHHLLLFISYRCYFHKKPNRHSWKNTTIHKLFFYWRKNCLVSVLHIYAYSFIY